MSLKERGQQLARSPAWRVARWVLVVVAFLLAWTGLTGPELLKRIGGDFFESDAFRTILVVAGLLLVLAVVLVPAPFRPEDWVVTWDGRLVPLRKDPEGYVAAAEWSESKWWLTLDRPSDEETRFLVTVRHETGATSHNEFFQADARIVVWYPDHFTVPGSIEKKPFGEYEVTWDVYPASGGHDVVKHKFRWS